VSHYPNRIPNRAVQSRRVIKKRLKKKIAGMEPAALRDWLCFHLDTLTRITRRGYEKRPFPKVEESVKRYAYLTRAA
jgi:hypothetical protein